MYVIGQKKKKKKKYEDCRSAIVMLEAIATNDALYCVLYSYSSSE